MNLGARHYWAEYAQLLASHAVGEKYQCEKEYKPENIKSADGSILIKNFMTSYDEGHKTITLIAIIPLGAICAIYLLQANIITLTHGMLSGNFLSDYGYLICYIPALMIFFFTLIVFTQEMRYLTIEGDQAIIHTKKRGKWAVPIKDLRFHIIEGGLVWKQYYLELEIPETTFTDYDRMFIIEIAAKKEILEGMLSVILSLFQGDTTAYDLAKKREYIGITAGEKPSLLRRYNNLTCHFQIWLTIYKYNQLLFWLLHKKWDKIFD